MYSFLLLLHHFPTTPLFPPGFYLLGGERGVGPKRIMIWSMTRPDWRDHLKNTSLYPQQLVMASHCSWQMTDLENSRYGKSIPALLTCIGMYINTMYSISRTSCVLTSFSTVHQIMTRHTIVVTHVFWHSLQICGSLRNGWVLPRHWGCVVGSSRYMLRLPT